jgi:hypothetical protein
LTDEKKVKATRAHLKTFKHEFIKYQKLFGLTGWDVKFTIKEMATSLAQICYVSNDCMAEVSLNSSFPVGSNIKKTAKHEAMHLLLARYDYLASARYINPEELTQANEEVTVKLIDIIP